MKLVKGTTRRVILVRSPDRKLFEEAIFIMREGASDTGVTAEQVLQEAQQVADGYARRTSGCGRLLAGIPAPAYATLGALLASAAWAAALYLPTLT